MVADPFSSTLSAIGLALQVPAYFVKGDDGYKEYSYTIRKSIEKSLKNTIKHISKKRNVKIRLLHRVDNSTNTEMLHDQFFLINNEERRAPEAEEMLVPLLKRIVSYDDEFVELKKHLSASFFKDINFKACPYINTDESSGYHIIIKNLITKSVKDTCERIAINTNEEGGRSSFREIDIETVANDLYRIFVEIYNGENRVPEVDEILVAFIEADSEIMYLKAQLNANLNLSINNKIFRLFETINKQQIALAEAISATTKAVSNTDLKIDQVLKEIKTINTKTPKADERISLTAMKKRSAAYKNFESWLRTIPLFVSILFWVILALVLFGILAWHWAGWKILYALPVVDATGDPINPIELLKIILPIIGGIGAVAYLVIKYQERNAKKREEKRAEEEIERVLEDRVETRMVSAIKMLGDTAASTRLSGVYALSGIADSNRGDYKQRVVEVLCGYLRTSRNEPHKKDSAVESTIINTMREHLQTATVKHQSGKFTTRKLKDDQLWCECVFDFHGTHFTVRVDFSGSAFKRAASFTNTTFANGASFLGATLGDGTSFDRATILGVPSFERAVFLGDISFDCLLPTDSTFSDASFVEGSKISFPATFPKESNGLPIGAIMV